MGKYLIEDTTPTMLELKARVLQDLTQLLDQDATLDADTRQGFVKNAEETFKALPGDKDPAKAEDVFEHQYDKLFLDDALAKLEKVIEQVGTERHGLRIKWIGLARSTFLPTTWTTPIAAGLVLGSMSSTPRGERRRR